jgi:glycolate oxidase FAD binding subunit
VEFSDRGAGETTDDAPLVIKLTAVPSAVPALVGQILEIDPAATIQSHAANGIIVARFAKFDAADLTAGLVGRLRPAAIQHGGSLTVLASQFEGLTQQIVWGGRNEASEFVERIKQQFDPRGILNPGRFGY